jgi:two-component system chemotaxis response regulator CheB
VTAMHKVRVLIVDDSTVIRRLLSDTLAEDPAIEVAGTAPNGRIALAKIPKINPDLITLNVEMPEMDGLATLSELRKTHPYLPVIMFSALTQRGAVAALKALALGASDCVAKPAHAGSMAAAMESVRAELIPKIKALCGIADLPHPSPATRAVAHRLPPAPPGNVPVEIVAIGVSTGGPNALTDIFRQLPRDFTVPIVVVQHMPPMFTKQLANQLNSASPLEVREAQGGELLVPGQAWLAPGNFHMALTRSAAGVTICLHQGPPENSCRPAADVLFRSVAELYGPAALAVVLTGMGQDGLRGCEAIHNAGGRIIAQDEATSVVWGMPGAVSTMGLANQVLPLPRIAGELTRLVALGDDRPGLSLASLSMP